MLALNQVSYMMTRYPPADVFQEQGPVGRKLFCPCEPCWAPTPSSPDERPGLYRLTALNLTCECTRKHKLQLYPSEPTGGTTWPVVHTPRDLAIIAEISCISLV